MRPYDEDGLYDHEFDAYDLDDPDEWADDIEDDDIEDDDIEDDDIEAE